MADLIQTAEKTASSISGVYRGAASVLSSEPSGLKEDANAQITLDGLVSGDTNIGLMPMAQAIAEKGDEANEALLAYIASNPEQARELLFSLGEKLAQNGITEQNLILQEFQTRQGKYLDKENDRFNQAMQMGLEPWSMMTSVTSIAGALGMLIKMGVDAGIVPPQYQAVADKLIENAEGWSDHVMENAPYSNMDGFNKSGDIVVSNAFDRAGRQALESQILAATATIRNQSTIEGRLGRAELYDVTKTTAGAFEALQGPQ